MGNKKVEIGVAATGVRCGELPEHQKGTNYRHPAQHRQPQPGQMGPQYSLQLPRGTHLQSGNHPLLIKNCSGSYPTLQHPPRRRPQ